MGPTTGPDCDTAQVLGGGGGGAAAALPAGPRVVSTFDRCLAGIAKRKQGPAWAQGTAAVAPPSKLSRSGDGGGVAVEGAAAGGGLGAAAGLGGGLPVRGAWGGGGGGGGAFGFFSPQVSQIGEEVSRGPPPGAAAGGAPSVRESLARSP